MSRIQSLVHNDPVPSAITPLFWQHGENEATLRQEIKQMSENGIGGFIIEARPHPDYLGEGWWRDLDIIFDEAKKRNMHVWLFDDSRYPSGFAAGKIRDEYPQHLKIYLAERHIDANGPLQGSSFLVNRWLGQDEKLIRIIAARRVDGLDMLDEASLLDVTDTLDHGILYWDVPEGNWRIFMLISTRNGGEEHTRDYLDPLKAEAVQAFLHVIYEEHFRRYGSEFGSTFQGFFTDEPRFGNVPSYDASLGNQCMEIPFAGFGGQVVLPYTGTLLDQLSAEWKADFTTYLPLLWYEGGSITGAVRYTYMQVVSRLFAENYTQQIGDWCRAHRVKLIGHVIEDNGAHARLGYGSGHLFRALKGMDYAGFDVVFQIWPEYTSGRFTTPFSYLHAEFFYWGLAKLASSAAHIDPSKQGITICEAFGAYGWQEGLKLMKWITDHICVRGTNKLIPHAFSPRFPDADCPPHFYAQGENPQWRYFHLWSSYANRVCHILSGGKHRAPVAVIYHAEAEWSGAYQPFEAVVKTLALQQIDCDVLPIDTFVYKEAVQLHKGYLEVNAETYQAIIVPYAERLPAAFLASLLELSAYDIPIFFMNAFPVQSSDRSEEALLEKLKLAHAIEVCSSETIVARLKALGVYDVECQGSEETLRYYHYVHADEQVYFFTNESKYKTIHTRIRVKTGGIPLIYNALENALYGLAYIHEGAWTRVELHLEAYESIFLVFSDALLGEHPSYDHKIAAKTSGRVIKIESSWQVSTADAKHYPHFEPEPKISAPGNIAVPGILPEYSGTIRYETTFTVAQNVLQQRVVLELGAVYEIAEVWLNGAHVGVSICPPYCLEVTEAIRAGVNTLRVDVTNTLAKKMPSDFDRAMPQEPSGLLGPVQLRY